MRVISDVADFRVAVAGELASEQVQALGGTEIMLDTDRGSTRYAGYDELGPMVTYMRVDAEDEAHARAKVSEALGIEPHNLVGAAVD